MSERQGRGGRGAEPIIDVHTHVGVSPGFLARGWWPYGSTTQDLIQLMDLSGVSHAVCFPFIPPLAFDPAAFAERGELALLPGRVPFDVENPRLAEEVRRIDSDGRLIPFAMFDPGREVEAQVKQFEPLIGALRGLKTQATVLQSPILALLEEGRPLMELAQQHDLPVLIHTSIFSKDTWSQVSDCLRVADAFAKARFCLAHSLRFHRPTLEQVASRPNVWIDCSAHLVHCQLAREDHPAVALEPERVDADYTHPRKVLEAVHAIVGERYLWGSDNPYMSWCDDSIRAVFSYEQEASVLHALPAAIRRSMATTGPQAWLGDRWWNRDSA